MFWRINVSVNPNPDPIMQFLNDTVGFDTADLKIPNLGKLECRPVLPSILASRELSLRVCLREVPKEPSTAATVCWEYLLVTSTINVSGWATYLCVTPRAEAVIIPPDVFEDRIGYVVVQIDGIPKTSNGTGALKLATVLGYVEPTVVLAEAEKMPPTEQIPISIPISQLRPLEDLHEHLDQLSQRAG